MSPLKNFLETDKYRLFVEASRSTERDAQVRKEIWRYYELQGLYGIIYPYSSYQPAVHFTSIRVANRFRKRANWKILQSGDQEIVYLIPMDDLRFAAKVIRARKKRQLSTEQREKRAQILSKVRPSPKRTSGHVSSEADRA